MIPREEKDIRLKEKIKAEADYAIHMAVTALKDVYDRGELIESEHSKECVWELRRLSDSVCAFLEEKLVKEKGKRLKRSDVFRMYEEYCEDNGRQGHAKSGFLKIWRAKGFRQGNITAITVIRILLYGKKISSLWKQGTGLPLRNTLNN